MRNVKTISIAAAICLIAATGTALAVYAPSSDTTSQVARPYSPQASYLPSHVNVLRARVADNCIDHGQTCTIGGTACCNAADTCKGTFPNTTCQ